MTRQKSRQGIAPKNSNRGFEWTVYRAVALHGPLTSVALSVLLDVSTRAATQALGRLARKDALVRCGQIPRPGFRGAHLVVYGVMTAATAESADIDYDDSDSSIRIDGSDLDWMNQQRQRAAEKAAFKNASR